VRLFGAGSRSGLEATVAAILVGLAWGIFCWWGDDSRWTLIRGAANVAGPWLVIAFWAGTQSPRWQRSALLGVLAMVAALVGYYASIELLDAAQASNRISLEAALSWAVVAVPVGLVCGAGGAFWRHGRWQGTLAVGLLAGALFGEGLLLLRETNWNALEYMAVPIAEVTVAFALVVALLDRREALRAVLVAGASGALALVMMEAAMVEVRTRLGDVIL